MKKRNVLVMMLAGTIALTGCQSSNKIEDPASLAYLAAVDESYAYKIATDLLQFKTNEKLGYRNAGSSAEIEASHWLVSEMETIGLEDVIREPFSLDTWTFEKADLSYHDKNQNQVNIVLGGYATQFNTEGPKQFQIIEGKNGTKEDLEGIDVAGKFVLIDINQRTDWWVTYPAYEAHIRGAAGVIVVQNGGYSEISDEALNAQDICGPTDAVAFSMSKKDATQLRAAFNQDQALTVTLDAVSTVSTEGVAYNVSGKIIGKDPQSYIIVSSHYDVYFDGFQDNNSAVALMMGMAKAFKDSNYIPEKTMIFISHAAEEWGATNTRYDWSTGAFNQVNKLHPEWAGQAFIDINFELTAYEHSTTDEIRTVYEYTNFLTTFSKIVPTVDGVYEGGLKVTAPLRTWSDDYSYSLAGIPALRNDFDSGNFTKERYHSQLDDSSTYNAKVMTYHLNMYGLMSIAFDQIAYMPMDFSTRLNAYKEKLEGHGLDDQLNEMIKSSTAIYDIIMDNNSAYIEAVAKQDIETIQATQEKAKQINALLSQSFKYSQDKFVRLTWEDVEILSTEHYTNNIQALEDSINALKEGNGVLALDEYLFLIDNNWYAYSFSKETYQYFTDYVLKQPVERLFWGNGRIMGHIDLYDIIASIQNKVEIKDVDFTDEIQKLQAFKEKELAQLEVALTETKTSLNMLQSQLEQILEMLTTK